MTAPAALTYPLCFDSAVAYQQWLAAQRTASIDRHTTYCSDCSPGYQAEMIRENRCLWPGTTFVRLPTGEIIGVRAP